MRYFMLLLTIVGLVLAFLAKGPGLLGIGILLAIIGICGCVFIIAAERVSQSARPDTLMATPDDFAAMRTRRPGPRAVPTPVRPTVVPTAAPRADTES